MTTAGFDITQSETIIYEKKDRVAWITLNRPERMNSTGRELSAAKSRALRDATNDGDILVVVLSGAGGRAFSAGADLKERAEAVDQEATGPVLREPPFSETDCPLPMIAAIDGYALGGGLEMALRCDIRIATEASRLALPEVRRGSFATYGCIYLNRMIPVGEAKMIQLTGAHLPARRAYEIGLIQSIVADRDALMVEAERIANEIKLCAPSSVAAVKRIADIGRNVPPEYAEALRDLEGRAQGRDDYNEGAKAFSEKRTPNWQPRKVWDGKVGMRG